MGTHPRTAVLSAILAFGLAPLFAQEATLSTFAPSLDFGLEERVRNERWNNVDLNSGAADQRNQYRFRTRIWTTANLTPDLQIAVGLCNEDRKVKQPDYLTYTNTYTGDNKTHTQFNGREILFETLYVDYKLSSQVSARVGRQDIMRGEGFILMDGTPGDGSRSSYFNAVDLAVTWNKSRLELIAIDNPAKDRFLPQVNEIDLPREANLLTEWDEEALGLYYSGKEWVDTVVDSYFVLKSEKNFNVWNPSKITYQPDRQFSTIGARVEHVQARGWTFTGEFARQWGRQDAGRDPRNASAAAIAARDIAAWGGYIRMKKAFDAPWKPALTAGYIALSGQDPDSAKITAWDPVFSRWPKWSDYPAYSMAPEKGVAYWSNLGMWQLEATCSPCKSTDLRLTWYHMAAFQPTTGKDKDRGDLYEVRADLRLSPSLKGHIQYERMLPGNFRTSSDSGYFFRAEVSYTFKKRFSL